MILPYIINVSVILVTCLAFYKLLLRRETFYKANRFLLITCLAVAFVLPLLQVPEQFSLRKVSGQSSVVSHESAIANGQLTMSNQATGDKQLPTTGNLQPVTNTQSQTSNLEPQTVLTWLFWLYWFGVMVFGVSFLFQVVLLLWRARHNPVIIDGPYRIVEVSGDK